MEATTQIESELFATSIRADLERLLRPVNEYGVEVTAIKPFGDGHSGETYEVGFAGPPTGRAILRLSPAGVRIAGPADIGRQGRIMAALDRAGMPVPSVILGGSEPAVAGRSFALLDFVEGEGWERVAARRGHRHLAQQAVDTLCRMQRLGLDPIKLDEPVRAPAEELERWAALIDRSPAELKDPATALHAALAVRTPAPTSRPVLVHGDYHYGNLIFANGQVIAVVDWEIAHLGEPLLDLGCLAVATMRSRYAPEPNPTGSVAISLSELATLYGADPGAAAWFVAVAAFKYAGIIGYNLELHRSGKRPDPIYEELQRTMVGLAADGLAVLEGGLDAV
jgi:aminoglycoside phosphotransferase (APT) family kinase protein